MTDYPFPSWRRVVFVASLILILIVTFIPSVTQGTVNVRVTGFIPGGGIVTHIYVKFSEVSLHTAGYPLETGWVSFAHVLPRVDLVPQSTQPAPDAIVSARIQSGRYDLARLVAANSTIIIDNTPGFGIPTGSTVSADVTLPIRPNGIGEVLVVVIVDYSGILDSEPQLTLRVLHATSG